MPTPFRAGYRLVTRLLPRDFRGSGFRFRLGRRALIGEIAELTLQTARALGEPRALQLGIAQRCGIAGADRAP